MPRTGGEADKLGNRYEALWIADAVLDLLDGAYRDLVFEPIGAEADGIEFAAAISPERREYHSIKRQQPRGNWTVRLLAGTRPNGRSILGDLFRKAEAGAEVVFSSGTSATEVEELSERARKSDTLDDFLESAGQNGSLLAQFRAHIVPLCGDEQAAYASLARLRVRVKNEAELGRDVERRIRWSLRPIDAERAGSGVEALSFWDFALDRLGRTITAPMVWQWLESRGLRAWQLAGDADVGRQMEMRNRLVLEEAEARLINNAAIPRAEADLALEQLLQDERSVMIEGPAGGGKSCAFAQVVRGLSERGVACLALRLDRLEQNDRPARRLGRNLGLPESPAITLGEYAGDRPSVLCIDQLDAISLVSARQQWAREICFELLEEARRYPQMRILFCCRSFDLELDPRLRSLVRDDGAAERIPVTELDEETIRSALAAAGFGERELTPEQLRVLANPLHLYLLLAGSHPERLDFSGPGELYGRYWEDKSSALELVHAGAWIPAVSALAETLSDQQSLSVPRHLLDEHAAALRQLASEGVVTISEEGVGFFHESFFDYAFARTFERRGEGLVDWLTSDDQPLFRRSQVRQVLEFLRRNGPDNPHYLETLAALLQDPGIRFHIKQLVLDWLGGLSDPTLTEWRIVEAGAGSLGERRWDPIRNSVPWFDLLQQAGRWAAWLQGDRELRERTRWLLEQDDVLAARAEVIIPLIRDSSAEAGERDSRLWTLVERSRGYAAEAMRALLLELVAAGVPERLEGPTLSHRDMWAVLARLGPGDTQYPIQVVAAWFDRQLELALRHDRVEEFSRPRLGRAYSHSSEDVIGRCEGDPASLARTFWPRFVQLEAAAPAQWLSVERRPDSAIEQLRQALARSLRQLAADAPASLDEILEPRPAAASVWVDYAVLQAWIANPGHYADRLVDFLLERPEQRFTIDDPSATNGFVGVTRTALSAASAYCSEDSYRRLEDSIVTFTPSWEWRHRPIGRTRLALLQCLPERRLSPPARRELRSLRYKFPDLGDLGAADAYSEDEAGPRYEESPIPRAAAERMSDDHWIGAIEKYPDRQPTWRGSRMIGGANAVARELEHATRLDPARFARFVERLDASHADVYIKAVLRGLTVADNGSYSVPDAQLAFGVIRRMLALDLPIGREVVWTLREAAGDGLPDDMLAIVIRMATEAADPALETWTDTASRPFEELDDQGLNSDRGAAATTLARLLFLDRGLWSRLKPVVTQLAQDPVVPVRACTLECLLAVLGTERDDALALFELTRRGADVLLGSRLAERFLGYAMYEDYAEVRPVLQQMLTAEMVEAVENAAQLITSAGLWRDSILAHQDARQIMELAATVRLGAAEIYARFVSDQAVGSRCVARLVELFDDPDADVRKTAARCWVYMEADDIPRFGSLLSAYAHSPAFEDEGAGGHLLAQRLRECGLPLPEECCEYLEQILQHRGQGDGAAAADLYGFPELAIRMHEETRDPRLQARTLDIIDEMMRLGAFGAREGVKQRFER